MTKTIAIIPARGGSKRLPNKNCLLLGGIPLVAHSILYAQKQPFIDAIYVSTNDAKIKEIALQYGAQVIDRPEAISGDNEPTITALQHVLDVIDVSVENVILLQPTNPLRAENLLQDAFHIYQEQKLESLFTVSRSWQKFGKIKNQKYIPYNYEIGQRSQDLEPLFFENGLLYITKATLIKQGIIISENAYPLEENSVFAQVDIDTQEDFDFAEFLINRK